MQGGDHLRMAVAADGGAPAAYVIDVAVVVHIPGVGAFDAIKNNWLAADGLECPYR